MATARSRPPEFRLGLEPEEICIDNFAGGGGASTGLDQVLALLGRHVDIAVNHDAEAIALHRANHPHAEHYVEDVFDVDIVKACRGRRVGFAWYSPDCTFHSKARGGKPFRDRRRARRIRGLAWVIIKQAKELLAAGTPPRIIAMENVQEFADWGPLLEDGRPCPLRRGLTFRRWCRRLQNLGYELDMWELKGCDYGAPTTRERLFIVARRDGLPVVKPAPSHGAGRAAPWRTAAECIDWSLPCPSIFSRARPLAPNTLRRIAEGIRRFVVNNPKPFIVPVAHAGDARVNGVDEPLRTITAERRGDFALVEPFLVRTAHGERDAAGKKRGRGQHSLELPLGTVTGSNDFAVAMPFVARIGQSGGNGAYVNGAGEPLTTVTTKAEHLLVAPVLVPRYGEDPHRNGGRGQPPRCRSVESPLPTIVTTDNGAQVVAAFLAKQNGIGEKMVVGQGVGEPVHTLTTRDQKAVVTSHLLKLKHHSVGQPVDAPLHTVQAHGNHYAEVRAFLIKFYSEGGQWGACDKPLATLTTKDRIGLVTIHGEDYVIVDIGMRMLTPRELYRAQGFPEDYRIAVEHAGKPLTKTAQVRMCGNSVCPPVAAAIVAAQLEVVLPQEAVA